MNCLHCNKHIYSFCDGELAPQLMLEMERHLAECPSCHFQYDLTMTENQILRDTSDIPELSADFNQRVMNAIMPEKTFALPGNVLVMSKDRRFSFRRSTMLILSAVAVVLLALYINLPDILSGSQPKVAQTNSAPKVELSKPQMKAINSEADLQNEQQIAAGAVNPYGNNNMPKASISAPDADPQLFGASRMTTLEAGRADRNLNQPLSITSLAVKNIPDKYKLVSQNNSIDNMAEYSYQTADGTETVNIQLNGPVEKAVLMDCPAPKDAAPMISAAPPAGEAVIKNVNREIEVDGQIISIVFSGNISSDELNSLADQVVLSKTSE